MTYPQGPRERIVLSDVGERFAKACTSRRTEFQWLAIDLCASRRSIPKGQELPQIRSETDVKTIVEKLLPNLADEIQESFGVICLDSKNQVVGFAVPFKGGVSTAPVDISVMLKVPLLVASCTGLIVFHNHPSGEPQASAEDVEVTKRLVGATKIVGLRLVDHVIVARKGTFSFAGAGLL